MSTFKMVPGSGGRAVFASVLLVSLAKCATALAAAGPAMVGPVDAAQTISIALVLPSVRPAEAASFVAHVSTPGDALFHHYLTPAQFAPRFGASRADYDAVVAWAHRSGLVVGEAFAARNILPVTGSAAALQAALGVRFENFRTADGKVFYAAHAPAALPADIAAKVAGVLGLSSYHRFAALARRLPAGLKPSAGGNGPGGAYDALDLRTAYHVPAQPFPMHSEVMAVFEQGGFDLNDIATYVEANKLPLPPVIVRGVNGYGGGINDPITEAEAVLDIDMLIAMNPAAFKVLVYEDGNDPFDVALVDSLAAMANENRAQTISISYGLDEVLQGSEQMQAENTVLTQLAAQGQSVLVASGDYGAYGDDPPAYNVSDPASQPLVTAVGGTTLYTVANAQYSAESAWNNLVVGAGATGGGISTQWPIPHWQKFGGKSVAVLNRGSAKFRNVPDVAAVANPLTGVSIYSALNGGWLQYGGTSASAPIWAGVLSLANSTSKALGFGPIGFASPSIYGLNDPNRALSHFFFDFNDVADGSNGDWADWGTTGFLAGYNYDNTTGWGSIGVNFVYDMALIPTSANTVKPPVPNGIKAVPSATSISLTWTAGAGTTAYLTIASLNNTTIFQTAASVFRKVNNVVLTGLQPNTSYVLQIFAIGPKGTSYSVPQFVTTTVAR